MCASAVSNLSCHGPHSLKASFSKFLLSARVQVVGRRAEAAAAVAAAEAAAAERSRLRQAKLAKQLEYIDNTKDEPTQDDEESRQFGTSPGFSVVKRKPPK